ncbi:MAG: amino acid adenylation domain-containing protein [Firmicutes bacterium]|nr:amino acid adenylation domain-containing protein [Bacillota bacterium]
MNYLSKENVQEIKSVSPVQKAILSGEDVTDDQIIQIKYEIEGAIHVDELKKVWQELVSRNPALRTVFRKARNRLYQVVLKERPIDMEVLYLEHINEEDIIKDVLERSRRSFQLMEEPLIRCSLLVIDEKQAFVIWTYHAIILDSLSREHLFSDFLSMYDALLDDIDIGPIAHRPKNNYIDWIVSQDWLPILEYWKEKLKDFEEPPEVGTDQPSKVTYPKFISETMIVPRKIREKLKEIMGKYDITLDAISQGAWAILLNVYSRENKVIFGFRNDGRPNDLYNSSEMIGNFGGLYPKYININGQQKVLDFLKELQMECDKMDNYSFVPLREIMTYCDINRKINIFENTLSISKTFSNTKQHKNITVNNCNTMNHSMYPLNVEFIIGQEWEIRFTHNYLKWEKKNIDSMMLSFCTILESIAKKPDDLISQMNLLTEEEKKRLLEITDTSYKEIDYTKFFYQYIEEQAKIRPDDIAAICEGEQISYETLNIKSNQIAHWLREQGIGRDDLVAIFAERSIKMLIAILAIMKSGAAYVPLDSKHPDARLESILDNVKAILTENTLVKRSMSLMKKNHHTQLVFSLDKANIEDRVYDMNSIQLYSHENLEVINEPNDLAYVFYTSGSTGEPKGVMIEHIGMINHLDAKITLLKLNEKSIVAQNASHCFDVSVWQFLAPLMVGGQVVIYTDGIANDPLELFKKIKKDQVSVLELVPVMIEMLLMEVERLDASIRTLKNLQYIISTGEGLPKALCSRWFSIYPHIKMVNTYGATECSDDTNHLVIDDMYSDDLGYVHLGNTIPNFKIYLLDQWKRPVPIGCTGEICLTGIGVGRGYINQPNQTKDSFVTNPFNDSMGDRMYLTGDLGRFLEDESLEFIGRKDFQVKIRGQRIELTEIESALLKCKEVRQCVAVIQKNNNEENRILAYVVLDKDIDITTLRDFIKKLLPEYMLPEQIIILESFKLNRNGKIDRKALPEPETSNTERDKVKPRNELEIRLGEIWKEVLGVTDIGIDDNFFEIGGHSLKTIQLRSRIRQSMGIDVSLKKLFKYQTIRELGQIIEEMKISTEYKEAKKTTHEHVKSEFYPLSNAQKRLYFLQQMSPDDYSYSMPVSYSIVGNLEESLVKRTFQTIIERHSVLRAQFVFIDGEPRQRIINNMDLCYQYIDLMGEDLKDKKTKLGEIISKEAKNPFNIEHGPLFRVLLIKTEEEHYTLMINMHHIISDAWSWQILKKEFSTIYSAYKTGSTNTYNEESMQYTDYIFWLEKYLDNMEDDKNYWLNQFKDELPNLNLPTDYPRPSMQSNKGHRQVMYLDVNRMEQLKSLCKDNDMTLFMLLMAITGILLAKLSGQNNIVLGVPASGRNQMEFEDIIGFFVNTLAIPIDINDEMNFDELLKKVKEQALDAYAHGEFPFELLVENLSPIRDTSITPIVSTFFQVITHAQVTDFDIDGLQIVKNYAENDNVVWDQSITFAEKESGLECNVDYRTDLYSGQTIQRWMKYLNNIIEIVCNNPQIKLSDITLLTDDERKGLLYEWNKTEMEFQKETCIHSLIEEEVKCSLDKTAVAFKSQDLKYSELNERANRMGRYLIKQGVEPGSLVGVYVNRPIDRIISLLGVLKAGAAYVPMDPAYPKERLLYMIQDSQTKTIITDSDNLEWLDKPEVKLISIDKDKDYILKEDSENINLAISSDDRAYVIYTSGSTGHPKGVQISHKNIVNFLLSMKKAPGITSEDIMFSVTSISFDIAGLEMYLPLIAGAKLVLTSRELVADGSSLIDYIETSKATIMQGTPVTWRMLLDSGWKNERDIKVLCGGEAMSSDLARELLDKSTEVWNLYGPTETTIWSSIYRVDNVVGNTVPIGKPIANTRMYILDKNMKPVPVGVIGELYIGGEGVSIKGYLNRPELTKERFVSDPFGQIESLMYKTGDLARYLPDGNIEYLNRVDHQVKIRGFRIELEEVESVLAQYPTIKEVIVMPKEDKQGIKELVAYILPHKDKMITTGEVYTYMKMKLPEYMIPSRFIMIDEIPLTPNGKIDKGLLPNPDRNMFSDKTNNPPRDYIEFELVKIWEEVLNTSNIQVYDNFFTVGGHSMLVMTLINKIHNKFGIQLPISTLFERSTIAELADKIRDNVQQPTSIMVNIQKGNGDMPPLFLIHPHGGGVYCYYNLVKHLGADVNVYGIQAVGLDSDYKPIDSLDRIVECYLEEIRAKQAIGPYLIGGWSFGGIVAYEIARRLEEMGEEIGFLGMLDVRPLTRLKTGEEIDPDESLPMLIKYAQLIGMDRLKLVEDDEDKLFNQIVMYAKEKGIFPQSYSVDLLNRKIKVMMANSIAMEGYQYRGKIQSDIYLFHATEGNEKLEQEPVDPIEWTEYTSGRLNAIEVEGDHYSFIEAPNVNKVAEKIKECLKIK